MVAPLLVELDSIAHLASTLDAAGLSGGQPVLVVVGGAAGLSGQAEELARRVIEDVAIPVAVQSGAAIVDGGTDSGVMRLVGRAHAEAGARTPLVGVAVGRLVRLPGRPRTAVADDAAEAERHHTHLVTVPGARWGDESPWLSAVAGHLSSGCAAVTLVVNGGAVTLTDVSASVSAGRTVVVAAGTGRTADLLGAQIRDGALAAGGNAQLRDALAIGMVRLLDPAGPAAAQLQLKLLLRPG